MVIKSERIEFYESENDNEFKWSEKISNIRAFVLNNSKTCLLIMRPQPRHILIKCDDVISVLKILYSLKYDDKEVPVYKVDIYNIDYMFSKDKPPHKNFLVKRVADHKVMDSMKGLSMAAKVKSAIKKPSLEVLYSMGN
jgi:hypothetical protein